MNLSEKLALFKGRKTSLASFKKSWTYEFSRKINVVEGKKEKKKGNLIRALHVYVLRIKDLFLIFLIKILKE